MFRAKAIAPMEKRRIPKNRALLVSRKFLRNISVSFSRNAKGSRNTITSNRPVSNLVVFRIKHRTSIETECDEMKS
jgi:hypothetical protein